MRKTFFFVFLCFAKDETDFFPYSNLHSKINSGSVLAKVSRNRCGSKCGTQIHKNDSKILEVRNHCTKVFKNNDYNRHFRPKMWPLSIGRRQSAAVNRSINF